MAKYRLYDNTRVSAFKQCPRKFFYRHIMHWTTDGSFAPELAFGAAWHSAQEVMWPGMIDKVRKDELIMNSYMAFLATWKEEGGPDPDEIDYELEKSLSPRTPGNALEMIAAYIDTRYKAIQSGEYELISVERPFIVPLDPNDDSLFYIGKIDKVVKRGDKYYAIEHKTTTLGKKQTDGHQGFRTMFIDNFSPNSQVDGYLYALHMTYPGKIGGVWVDAALVHKSEQAFLYIPVEKKMDQLDLWLWEVRSWIDQIEHHKEAMANTKPEDPYMAAFPKDDGRCFDYMRPCSYLNLCRAWANPIGKEIPPGFKIDEWNPLDHVPAAPLLDKMESDNA